MIHVPTYRVSIDLARVHAHDTSDYVSGLYRISHRHSSEPGRPYELLSRIFRTTGVNRRRLLQLAPLPLEERLLLRTIIASIWKNHQPKRRRLMRVINSRPCIPIRTKLVLYQVRTMDVWYDLVGGSWTFLMSLGIYFFFSSRTPVSSRLESLIHKHSCQPFNQGCSRHGQVLDQQMDGLHKNSISSPWAPYTK